MNTSSTQINEVSNRKQRKPVLKPIKDQVIVITGASSGIGLVTARMAVHRGAKIILAARNESALRQLSDEMNQYGLEAIYVEADVGKEEDVQRIADTATRTFGTFDTWINNAGVSIYGDALQIPVSDMRKMFETNFWGVVYGSRLAALHFIKNEKSGAIINVGSFLGDKSLVLQAAYSAAKHAVHGWTEALRTELEMDNLPISISLIHPARVNTPFPQHARSYSSNKEPDNTGYMYAPEAVADAILYCAEHPKRDMHVGLQSRLFNVVNSIAPGFMDALMEGIADKEKVSAETEEKTSSEGALEKPGFGMHEKGNATGYERSRSYYAKASKHPLLSTLIVAGIGAGLLMFTRRKSQPKVEPDK